MWSSCSPIRGFYPNPVLWAGGFQKSFINYFVAGKKMDIINPIRLGKSHAQQNISPKSTLISRVPLSLRKWCPMGHHVPLPHQRNVLYCCNASWWASRAYCSLCSPMAEGTLLCRVFYFRGSCSKALKLILKKGGCIFSSFPVLYRAIGEQLRKIQYFTQ